MEGVVMIETVIDYLIDNKYVLVAVGFVGLHSLLQALKYRKLKKKLNALEEWSKKMYEYMATSYGGQN